MGQGTLSDLGAEPSASEALVFVRVVASARGHEAWYVDAIVSPPSEPPGWQAQTWLYAEAVFIAAQVPGPALAAALDPAGLRTLSLGDCSVTLPAVHDQVTWQHRPSRVRYDSMMFPWPVRSHSLSSLGASSQDRPRSYLIGDDCPSFPSFDAAFRAF